MYSPKIREDLIPLIYRQSKQVAKTMTKYIDDLIRPLLIDNENMIKDENNKSEEMSKENEKGKGKENKKGNDEGKDFDDYYKIDIEEKSYCCESCRMQVNETDGEKGYCEICECEVFVEKI